MPYDRLAPTDHPLVDLGTGGWSGPLRPTSEIALHLGLMRALPDVGAIVHTHSRYAAAFAVARRDLPFICNESMVTRAEQVLVTEYAPPGSVDLAEQALATFRRQPGSRAVLLANHGVVALGPTVDDAYLVAQAVEWTAEICHLARTLVAAGHGETVLDRERAGGHRPQLRRHHRRGDVSGRWMPTRSSPGSGSCRSPARAASSTATGPVPTTAGRAPGSAIWFLVTDAPDGFSQFHRLTIDEIWHRYAGDPAELVLLEPGGTSRHVVLGGDLAGGRDARCTSSRPARGWPVARPGAGACSARPWPPASRRTTSRPPTRPPWSPAGPHEAAAIAALTRPG